MSKVTYLLGAGASYGQLVNNVRGTGVPIVCEFSDAIQQMLNNIKNGADHTAKHNTAKRDLTEQQYDDLIEDLSVLLTASQQSITLDHYAKQLLLLHESNAQYGQDNGDVYRHLKRLLSVFLLMVQYENGYDKRYEWFLSEIMDVNNTLPELTVLSWNYDAQFELAYAQYAEKGRYILQLWDAINVYNKTCNTNYNPDAPFALVKLNGTAFFLDHHRETKEFKAHYIVPDPFNGGSRDYYQNIHTFLTDFYQETTLSYAWEHDSLQPTIDVVRHRVLDTEELVIIGYSLPRFNAIVDAEILRAMPNLKRVVIQDKEDVCKQIESKIKQVLWTKNLQFEYVTNLNGGFYVPYLLGTN